MKIEIALKSVLFNLVISMFFGCCPVRAAAAYASGYEIIVDNSQVGNGFSSTSGWKVSECSDAYKGTARFIDASASNAEKAKWTPDIPVDGYYKVYMTWPYMENAAESIGVQIHYGGGCNYNARKINQNYNSGYWVDIGTYYMTAGTDNYVALKPDKDGYAAADAVKLVLSQEVTEDITPEMPDDISSPLEYNSNETLIVQNMTDGSFSLSVNGEPYYIKGICKSEGMDKIREAGGNTVRTYSSVIAGNTTKPILDKAEQLGMKVVLGLSMPKETDEFTYTDNYDDFISGNFENLKKQINAFKDHPAVLMWAVGNEIDPLTDSTSSPASAIYKAINEVAQYIKEVDPYHPVTTVHAGASAKKISGVKKYAPCIDIVSANVYKGISSTYDVLITSSGWQGAYMITEFSTNQPSEVIKYEADTNTVFDDVVIEKTDSEKAQDYYDRYQTYIYDKRDRCLGSFAFAAYGAYRGTHTWYNVFLEDEYKTTPVYDALYRAWNGVERTDTAPSVESLSINTQNALDGIVIKPGGDAVLQMDIQNRDNDILTYKFEIRPDSMDKETSPVENVTFETDTEDAYKVNISQLPSEEGIYRLFVYVYDNGGNIGYGNIPFKISSVGSEVKVIASENFAGINSLSADYTAPAENGFKSTWKRDKALTADSEMKITDIAGHRLAMSTPNSQTQNIFNTLETPIDMDSESTYYASWIQGYNSSNISNSYVKTGFLNEDDTQEISGLFMFSANADMPVIGIKSGTGINYSDEMINKGSLYNILLKIEAGQTENDVISLKVWPIDTQEPYGWTYTAEKDLTGCYTKIFFQANPSNGSRAYFGEFSMEQYAEGETAENIYKSVGEYLVNTAQMPDLNELPVGNGVMYKSVSNMLNLKTNAYIKEIILLNDGKRVTSLPQESGDIAVEIIIKNDSNNNICYDNEIYAALYNAEGKLCRISEPSQNISVAGESKESIVFDFGTLAEEESGGHIKVFVWKNSQIPVQFAVSADSNEIINY